MTRNYHHALFSILLCFYCLNVTSQTLLYPGDIAVVSVATNMEFCGLGVDSDEISFFSYQDITQNTVFHLTDNGFEVASPGEWGDGEGTLQITRTGNTVPAGTVITLQALNMPGGWQYRIIEPALGWAVTEVNTPGIFNLETGGDQVLFLHGGTWDNQGVTGDNDATYSGSAIFGLHTGSAWIADGTTHHSNLPVELDPCYYVLTGNSEYYKYTGDQTPGTVADWLPRIQDPSNWTSFPNCTFYSEAVPFYPLGYTMPVTDLEMSVFCQFCEMCPGTLGTFYFMLPPGMHDVVFTNGTDTIELIGIENFHNFDWLVEDTISFWLISVTPQNGCPLPPHFTDMVTFLAPKKDPGLHRDLFVCPDYEYAIPLFNMLNGTPDPGGYWSPPLSFGLYYYTAFGPGRYTYVHRYPQPPPMPECPADTASVDVIFVNAEGTTMEIGCDQNGTPNYIFDDATTILLTATGNNFGPTYNVTVSSGTITPTSGITGVPTLFTLQPGSAMGPNVTLSIENVNPPVFQILYCMFDFLIESPGFCSDPCDYSMEASISGDADICDRNCPDNPGYFQVEVSGGTPPYTMDLNIAVPGFPSWNILGMDVEEFTEFQICIDTIPAPLFDEGTNTLILPASIAGEEALITLSNVYDFYNCTASLSESELFLSVHELPEMDTIDISLCSAESFHFDLTVFDLDISPFWDVTWWDGNPFTVGEQIISPHTTNMNNVVELWARIEDDYCANAIPIAFTIRSSPELDSIGPIEICRGEGVHLDMIPIVDHGDSMAIFTYYINTPFDTTTLIDTTYYEPADSVTIYLLAEANDCYDTLAIQINVQEYPDFMLQATPCDLISGTYTVMFNSSADSVITSHGTITVPSPGTFSITGIPNDTNMIIEILNPSGLCRDTFSIQAPNCNCPSIDQPVAGQPAYAICEGNPIPTLAVTVTTGLTANWYDVPSGGVALLQNSLTYQPANMTSAIYYVEAFDASNGCSSIRTAIPLTVHPVAQLQQVADQVLCQNETLDLNTLVPGVINGVSGSGSWYHLADNQPASGVVTPANGQSWYYVFTSTAGNCVSRDTFTAVVNENPSMDIHSVVCDETTLTYAIYFTSDAENVQVNTGTLVQIPSTDSFYIELLPFNTDLQFLLENLSTGCFTNINQPAPNCSCPDLLQQSSLTVCSDASNIDMNTYVGFGVSGSWQMVSTPPGSNPASLAGNTFNGVGADPGLYTLRYIRNVILDDCIDTAAFQLTLLASPQADAGTDGVVCATDIIQLSGTASGNNLQFSWTTSGSGPMTNPNSLTPTYNILPGDITNGSITFTLTASDGSGVCPSALETITITIDGSTFYLLDNTTQTYCDTSDVVVDLDDVITFGTTGGHWFFSPPVPGVITGDSQFNPSDLSAGNYTVYYTTTNAVPPCTNDTAGLTIIIENCLCPSVALSPPTEALCSTGGSVDLDDFLITTEAGTWSISGTPAGVNPATLNGSMFSTNNADAGTYTLRFTLSTPPMPGCDAFAEIQLEVIPSPSLQLVSVECAEDLQSWEAIINSNATVILQSHGILTSLGGGQYQITGIPLLTALNVDVSNGNGLCTASQNIPAPDCECTLAISNLPDAVSLCPEETIVLDANVDGGKGAVISFWAIPGDSIYQETFETGIPGTYIFVTEDELGCKQEHTVNVNVYTEMLLDVSSQDVTCPGDQDGSIMIHEITGGTGPYSVSVNNGPSQSISAFPFIISDLGEGQYDLEVTDATNCILTVTISVSPASMETLSLGPDQTILVGDSLRLDPTLTFIPDTFSWSGDIVILDTDLLDQWISPDADVSLVLTAVDEKGCTYTDNLFIRVLLNSSIYVPNVFSPNGDGVNDIIAPLTDPSIVNIEYFEIFSRWGELVYSVRNVAPNQANIGWNGTFHNEPMQPGVFVYRLSATNKRGRPYSLYGDLTLIR